MAALLEVLKHHLRVALCAGKPKRLFIASGLAVDKKAICRSGNACATERAVLAEALPMNSAALKPAKRGSQGRNPARPIKARRRHGENADPKTAPTSKKSSSKASSTSMKSPSRRRICFLNRRAEISWASFVQKWVTSMMQLAKLQGYER